MLLMPNDKYGCEWDEHRWSRSGFCLDCGEEGEEPNRDDVPIDGYLVDDYEFEIYRNALGQHLYIPEDE